MRLREQEFLAASGWHACRSDPLMVMPSSKLDPPFSCQTPIIFTPSVTMRKSPILCWPSTPRLSNRTLTTRLATHRLSKKRGEEGAYLVTLSSWGIAVVQPRQVGLLIFQIRKIGISIFSWCLATIFCSKPENIPFWKGCASPVF